MGTYYFWLVSGWGAILWIWALPLWRLCELWVVSVSMELSCRTLVGICNEWGSCLASKTHIFTVSSILINKQKTNKQILEVLTPIMFQMSFYTSKYLFSPIHCSTQGSALNPGGVGLASLIWESPWLCLITRPLRRRIMLLSCSVSLWSEYRISHAHFVNGSHKGVVLL